MDEKDIPLADAIEAVRAELQAAAERAEGQSIQFEVGPVSLDFTVELRQDVKAKGGFKAWVLAGDAEAGLARNRLHKISVTLTPKDTATGESPLVGNPDLGNLGGFAVDRD